MENFAHAVAGSTASMSALTIFYPLERVRTIAQVSKNGNSSQIFQHILKTEGILGFYKGLSPIIQVLGTSNFVYFYIHAILKFYHSHLTKKSQISSLRNVFFTSFAGILNVLITNPLWLVATRKSLDKSCKKSNNLLVEVMKVYKTEGVLALWKGTVTSLFLVSNPAIQFAVYERLKQVFGRKMSSFETFMIGAFAKIIATLCTYPLQTAQTRLRHERNEDSSSTLSCLSKILKEEGIKGWFKGLDAKLTQTTLTAAFMFVFYERIVSKILTLAKVESSF